MIKIYGKRLIALVMVLAMVLTMMSGLTLSVTAADSVINTGLSYKKNGVAIDASQIQAGDTVTVTVSLTNYDSTLAAKYPIGALQINVGVNTSFVTVSNVKTLLAGNLSGESAAAYNSSKATVTYAELFYVNGAFAPISGAEGGRDVMSFDITLSASAAQKRVVFSIATIASSGSTTDEYPANDGNTSFICGGTASFSAPTDYDFSNFASLYGVTSSHYEVGKNTAFEGSNINHPYASLLGIGQLNTAAADFYTVTTDKLVYTVGEAINVTAVGQNTSDWVGIYAFNDKLGENAATDDAIYWTTLGSLIGNTVDITDTSKVNRGYRASTEEEQYYNGLTAGLYTIIMLPADGSTVYASVNVRVVESGASASNGYSVSTDKNIYEVGEPINVTATGTGSADWVGLYVYGDDFGTIDSIYWYNLSGTSTVDITDLSKVTSNTAGEDRYEFQAGLKAKHFVVVVFATEGNDAYVVKDAVTLRVVDKSTSTNTPGTMLKPFSGLTNLNSSYKNGVVLNSNSYAYIGSYDFSTIDTITVTYATTSDFDSSAATLKFLKSDDMSDVYVSSAIASTGGYMVKRNVTISAADYAGPVFLALDGEGSAYITEIDYRSATDPGLEVSSDTIATGGTLTGTFVNAGSGWSVALYEDETTSNPVASTTLSATSGSFSLAADVAIGMYDLYLVDASGNLYAKHDIIVNTKVLYTITLQTSPYGTALLTDTTGYAGDVIGVVASANEGYEVTAILVDGVAISGNTFTVTGNHTVAVNYTQIVTGHTITVVYGGYGLGEVTIVSTANAGDTIDFTATPMFTSAGLASACTKVTSEQATITTTTHATGQITGGSFVMPDADVTITINFQILGDVRIDGSISSLDYSYTMANLRGKMTLNEEQLIVANVYSNTSTAITSLDYTYIMMYLRGKLASFPNNLCN